MRISVLLSPLLCAALGGALFAADELRREIVDPVPIAGMGEWHHQNLERNLRWIVLREGRAPAAPARVAVFGDAGVWHLGARSIVESLEREGIPCRVLDRARLRMDVLKPHTALILPGGWAPYQWTAAGSEGLGAIRSFVEQGGRCVGVCAGAYLLSRETRYDGITYPYPLGLFDGTADGPVPGLAAFPEVGSATVTTTDAAKRRGLTFLEGQSGLYSGGPRFLGGTGTEVLARYADGSPAAIARRVGKGEIILLGLHFERPVPQSGGDNAPVPAIASKLYRTLLFGTEQAK